MYSKNKADIKDTPESGINAGREGQYRHIYYRFVLMTLISSLLPLLLVGWGINLHYSRFARQRMIEQFNREIDHHRQVIELFIKEHCSKLLLIAQTQSKEHLCQQANLSHVFELINQEYASLTDLGVIDHDGRHLAYIGPYDLMEKNYAQADWFKQVMEQGIHISDMFLGFRREPHFIIAATASDEGGPWVLRATIDTEAFRSLVENVRIGNTGEVYLLNAEGYYQTTPRFHGNIMEKARHPLTEDRQGIDIRIVKDFFPETSGKAKRQIVCSVWLKEPHWLLVVRQDYDEAFNSVNHANRAVLIFLHISALSILVVAILITRHMLRIIRRRDSETDHLNEQLVQTSKLASIGELSAGVAHEINNPLAIMLTERQILLDCVQRTPDLAPAFREQLDDSLNQMDIQIHRCKRITQNLLRFSRRTTSMMASLDLNDFLMEIVELMEREARSGGISFITQLLPELPLLISDVSQLQQVFLNLITNAIDAHDGMRYGRIYIATTLSDDGPLPMVHVRIQDTGSGISPEHLPKIFDPFFTTKPVGKGTGLGLSICLGIIQRLGGTIEVDSTPGQGTCFDVALPVMMPETAATGVNDGVSQIFI